MLEDADAFVPFAGKNGQLFIAKAGDIDLVDLFGKTTPPGRLLQWRRTFERRGRELKRRNIHYVVNFAPSAHVVCADDLPDDLAGKLKSPVPALLEMGPIDNVTFIDSFDALRRPGAEFAVYRKTDSHWSQYGAWIAYRDACREIGKLAPVAPMERDEVDFSLRRGYGDLSVFMKPEGPSEHYPRCRVAARRAASVVRENKVVERNRHIEYRCDGAPSAAMIFHDSYLTAQAPFWTRSFGRTLLIGITSRVFLDAVDAWRPDVVISEMADHRLFQLPQDHEPWTFHDEFECDCDSPAGRVTAQALILLRQMKTAEAAQALTGVEEQAGFDAHHARVAAQVFVSNREFSRALEMSRIAVAARPDRASYLWISAYAEAYNNNPEAAVNFATWAVGADPDNGAFAAFLASLLIGLQRWDAAAVLLENITPRLSDAPDLWRSLKIVRAARGDSAGAEQAGSIAKSFEA